jgi:hypothetical protein
MSSFCFLLLSFLQIKKIYYLIAKHSLLFAKEKSKFFPKLNCTTSMIIGRWNDIIELLLQNSFKKEEKKENINWKLYRSISRKENR